MKVTYVEPTAKSLVTAALLHDIGKFMQRASVPLEEQYSRLTPEDIGKNGAHSKWSASFVSRVIKDPVVEDLVLQHHQPARSRFRNFAEIVQEADHLSSAIDRKGREGTGRVLEEPLKSVFTQVHLGRSPQNQEDRFYPLKPLGIGKDTIPVKKRDMGVWNLSDSYKDLWKAFDREAEQIPKNIPTETVMALLKKYTSCIPSAVYVNEPDIPLSDHSKTTAAIAHCLLEGDKEKPFLFVHGDLSGIQNFIFSTVIPDQARKGTAKRLRGRSFWLNLLMDAVAYEIITECSLFAPSVLWNTGGNFLILAPNTKEFEEKVARIGRKINEHLFRRFDAQLSVTLVTLPVDREGIKAFSKTHDQVAILASEKKKQKFLECGIEFGIDGQELPLSEFCPICGVQVKGSSCSVCDTFHEIGTKITRAMWLLRGEGLPISFGSFGLQASYDLVTSIPDGLQAEVFSLNETIFPVKNPSGSGFLFLGNTVPIDYGEVLTFGEMAQLSKGTPRLGYVKADVDNLGKIFAEGLPDDDRTVSRIHTLSSQLQYFFAGHINHLCDQFVVYRDLCDACKNQAEEVRVTTPSDEGESIQERVFYRHDGPCRSCQDQYAVHTHYITYSGGDDLLIIGPWDSSIRLAHLIDDEFRRFTCENPSLTLSAGIAIVSPRLPVSRAVAIADGLLEDAKAAPGKDHVTVFDECLSWREGNGEKGLSSLIVASDSLMAAVEKRSIPKGMIYAFLSLWDQTFGDTAGLLNEEQRSIRLTRKRYLPLLKYYMKRNIRNENDRRSIEELVVPAFPWIRLPVYWTSLALRRERSLQE